jgi:hypothetical protein
MDNPNIKKELNEGMSLSQIMNKSIFDAYKKKNEM